MNTVLTWLANAITGSLLDKALSAWQTKVNAQTNADKLAADLTIESFKAEIEQRKIAAGLSWGPLGVSVMLFVVPTALYYGIVLFGLITGYGAVKPVDDTLVADIMRATVNYVLPGGIAIRALHMAATRFGK